MAFEIYKRGQGKYTRTVTFAAGALIGGLVARYVWKELNGSDLGFYEAFGLRLGLYLVYGVPVVIFAAVVLVMYLVTNRPRGADFMIATEGEMKKVSWSSRREIIGGTKVVIAATFILALMLWAVDLAFGFFFNWVGVLQAGTGN